MNWPLERPPLEAGEHHGIQWAVAAAPIYGAINGYVRIPKGHPWSGLDYDDVEPRPDVHGGLTYGKDGWFGFDTLHAGDLWLGGGQYHLCDDVEATCNCKIWNLDMVVDEAKRLAEQVAACI